MPNPKAKVKNKKINPIYFKLFGLAWLIISLCLLVKNNTLKTFGIMFFGGDLCGSCTQVGLLSLGLCLLIFAVGALSLAYGVLLTEAKPDPTPSRVLALTCAIAVASLVVFGWINFAVNY